MEADELGVEPPLGEPLPPVLPSRPVAARRPVVHENHGVSRPDDYAWLRDTADPEVLAYLKAEHAHYERTTRELEPVRTALYQEMVSRTPTADTSVGWRQGGLVYFTRTQQGEEHDRLYRLDEVTGDEHLVLDPNRLTDQPEGFALGLVEPSPDGATVAFCVDRTGAERFDLRFRDVATGEELTARIPEVSYGGAWSADSRSFFYTVADPSGRTFAVRRHELGSDPAADPMVHEETDRRYEVELHGTRDGRWVVITAASRDTCEVYLVPADDPSAEPRSVAPRRDGVDYAVDFLPGGWDGAGEDLLLIVTDDGAPEFRLLQTPVPTSDGPGDAGAWEPVPGLRAQPGERLESVAVLIRHVVLTIRRDGEPFLRVVDRPQPGAEPLARPATREVHPGVPFGQLHLWHLRDPSTTHVVIEEENLVTPTAWVEVDLDTGARTVIKRTVLPGVDPMRYVTDRVYGTAPDGARIPVTLARRRDARRGHTEGCVLTGYGAYEVANWPTFDVGTLSLIDRDLVVAVAHVRGGGELGRRWWQAARGRGKPRTFVDYVAARDALVAAGWAGQVRGGARVVTRGRSAGGLLQGAVFSRAPRMWRAVIAEVPFVDVVTTLCDPTLPLTVEEWDEWGDPVHHEEDFASMLSWSPYDNPPPPGRPPLLVTGVLHDPRVLVHEPAKWVARLRATDDVRAPSPLLLRVEFADGAHAGPPGRRSRLRYEAEILAWALDQLGLGSGPG